jgi:hypothetical protein
MDNATQDVIKTGEASPQSAGQSGLAENKLAILGHSINRKEIENSDASEIIIELNVKNVLNRIIGSVVFEAIFYDKDNNIIDKVRQKTTDLGPNVARTIRISYPERKGTPAQNYNVTVTKIAMPPEPVVTGNDLAVVTKHIITPPDVLVLEGIEFAIKNVTDKTIATLVFEYNLFDSEGNVLKTQNHIETNLRPQGSRGIVIKPVIPDMFKISSYTIRLVRTVTTDHERVQIIKHEMINNNPGDITVICKNISEDKTNAALIAKFFNFKKETIGIQVIPVRDIEPSTTKQFYFMFIPVEGDVVKSHEVNIGDLLE